MRINMIRESFSDETAEVDILRGVLRLTRALRRSVPAGEVSGGALSLLAVLRTGGPMSAVAAAQGVGLQPQSLSRLLVRLEREALIERAVDPTDRRRHVIALTQQGRAALARSMEHRRGWLSSAMAANLDPGERATLSRAAELMLRIADSDEGGRPSTQPDTADSQSDPTRRSMVRPTEEPTLITAEPQLLVTDMEAASAFYVDRLGFTLAFAYGDPPFYAQVRRGGARLNLRHTDDAGLAAGLRDREPDLLSATITVEGLDALFQAFDAAGVEWHQALKSEPWGARSFIVRDPDGNLIYFAEAADG